MFYIFAQTLIVGTRKNRLAVAVLTSTQNQCFEQNNIKNIDFSNAFFIFTGEKNRCILHWQVFVMIRKATVVSYRT